MYSPTDQPTDPMAPGVPPPAEPDESKMTPAATWVEEVTRSQNVQETYWPDWQENLDSYVGKSKDAASATLAGSNFINTNADFTNAEVKVSQLFFEQPELQLTAKGAFRLPPPPMPGPPQPGQPQAPDGPAISAAHRELLNELLGPDFADALQTVQKAIKDCLVTAGVGA